MGKFKNIYKQTIAEMTGKVERDRFNGLQKGRNILFGHDVTVDYARNDYDLFRAIYWASRYNGRGEKYLLGSAFGKPVVNSAAAFVIGLGVGVTVTRRGEESDEATETATEQINEWLRENQATIYDAVKHSYRDGDTYLYVDEFGKVTELDANTVTVMLDPVSGETIGFDVLEVVEERNPDGGQTTNYQILKQYRRDSIRYTKLDAHGKKVSTIFDKVFTTEGTVTPTENQEFLPGELVYRQLPVVHVTNEKEPKQIYGNSEYQNLLVFMRQYHGVLAEGVKGVIYNSTPVPVFKGVQDDSALEADSHKDKIDSESDDEYADKGKLSWGQESVVYLEGEKGDAKFLQADDIMPDVKEALKVIFYNVIEASETPEFVFGTAVQSSKSSTETQMPIMIQKAKRKRTQLSGAIKELVKAYIDRQIRISNPDFFQFQNRELDIRVDFPELVDEDKKLNKEIVQLLLQEGLISDQTAVDQLLGDKISDVSEELDQAKQDNADAVQRNNVFPEQPGRLEEEEEEEEEEV